MSKQVTIQQNRFDGGISDSPREFSGNSCRTSAMFDIFTDNKSLIPYKDFEDDSTGGNVAQYKITDFAVDDFSTNIYGLGEVVATGFTKILSKTDYKTGNWTAPASSEGNGVRWKGCFAYFMGTLWGFQGTTQVWKGLPGAITNTAATVGTITSVAQGCIAKDTSLYLPYNNKLVRVSPSLTVTDAVLTLPSTLKITSLCNYGNYLAIACAPTSVYGQGYANSKVFLWNLTSPDVQETIDWGDGDLKVLDVLDGNLIGITDHYISNDLSAGRPKMIIKQYVGGVPITIRTISTGSTGSIAMTTQKQIKGNRIFFKGFLSYDRESGSYYGGGYGIYSFGRKDANSPYSLSLDFTFSSGTTTYFGCAGDYFFATDTSGLMYKTNDAESFTNTSSYETQILNFGDTFSDKRLENIKLSFRKLLSGESVVLKYKVDNSASTGWTTIGTYNTVGGISHTFVREESTPKDFTSGKEYQFRIESTGGAEITGWSATATVLNNV